jgi:hypothetical protein
VSHVFNLALDLISIVGVRDFFALVLAFLPYIPIYRVRKEAGG